MRLMRLQPRFNEDFTVHLVGSYNLYRQKDQARSHVGAIAKSLFSHHTHFPKTWTLGFLRFKDG